MIFNVVEKVWLSTRNISTTGPWKELNHKHSGPCMVSTIMNKNAYKLDFPKTMWIHDVFHVSLLD